MSRRKRYTRNLGRSLPEPLPVRTTAEWVRFEHAREPYGVFCYLPDAREARPELTAQIDALYDWFNFYLTVPSNLYDERFWFRAEATRYVEQGRRLAELVRSAYIPIIERRIRRVPGLVRFQDREQVAVLTFRDTARVSRVRTIASCR